ncbi:hypothetical protein QOZ80_6BG0466570 [Eleusine coracana subsp. coracana]|nr:hypothetical protein QOZ80_6BG0466570 [Eleusine coracana subsp. coracana]
MLGFVYRYERANQFIPTSSFRPPCAKLGLLGHWNWYPIDARHGFFLFFDVLLYGPAKMTFIVLNPITGKEWKLPMPKFKYGCWSAAVLCGTAGCDHLDCPCDAFHVVFVGTRRTKEFTSACVYSSQAGTWSMTASIRHPKDRVIRGRSAFVGNKLYFICWFSNRILEYDLGKQELEVISLPSTCKAWGVSVMTADVQKGKLCIWSREEAGPEGWEQRKVSSSRIEF